MARLDPLIRLRKHKVDEKQRVLAELYREIEKLQIRKTELLVGLAREQELAETMPDLETRTYFGRYAQAVRQQVEDIEATIKRMDVRVLLAQDDVRDAFAELKKVEITNRERKNRERKEQDAKESRRLDDIGIEGHRRKHDDKSS